MNFRLLPVLALCLQSTFAFSQKADEVPNLKMIQAQIKDPTSAMYFPNLLKRYQQGDTTMNWDQKRALYYGSAYQESFSSFGSMGGAADSVRAIMNKSELGIIDFENILVFTDSVLRDNPFDLRNMKYRRFAAKKLGNADINNTVLHQRKIIFDAIMSTGDGKAVTTAFWVTNVSDEYELLEVLGFEFGGSQSLVDGPCDYLTIKKNEYNIDGLYFNVEISFSSMEKMLGGGKKKRSKK